MIGLHGRNASELAFPLSPTIGRSLTAHLRAHTTLLVLPYAAPFPNHGCGRYHDDIYDPWAKRKREPCAAVRRHISLMRV